MEESTLNYAKESAGVDEVKEFLRNVGMDEKGIDAFFLQIMKEDSLNKQVKVGNLTEEELGTPFLPIRTLMDLSNDCDKISSLSSLKKDFETQAQNMVISSLSKEGFFIKARITQKKELLDNKKKRIRKGLFQKKEIEE